MKKKEIKKFAIIAPAPIKGSGGVARIFTFASELSKLGFSTDIYIFDGGSRCAESISKEALDFYGASGFRVICSGNPRGEYNFIMATRWDTAKLVRDSVANHKIYLVQDFEASFNPVGDGTIFAENSYLYGLQIITYGRWLAKKISVEYGCRPKCLDFSSDTDSFFVKTPYADRETGRLAVCFIYQHDKPRRCPRLGIEALGIVKHLRPNVDIYLVGSEEAPALWFEHINCGILNLEGLNDLYNKCNLGLCLSSSNPSCNPFDMMCSGLPSVELYRENNLYDIPEGGVLLAHQTPESIAEALIHLLDDVQKREDMSEFGVEFMRGRTKKNELEGFLSIIDEIDVGKVAVSSKPSRNVEAYGAKAIVANACQTESVNAHVRAQLNSLSSTENAAKVIDGADVQSFGLVRVLSRHSNYTHNMSRVGVWLKKLKKWLYR